MNPDFRTGLARLVPVFMPDLLFRLAPDGTPLFKEFAAAIRPTEFLPGKVFGTGTMAPIDYCVELAEGQIAPPANLDIATVQQQELATTFRFQIPQYLSRRAAGLRGRARSEAAGTPPLKPFPAPTGAPPGVLPRPGYVTRVYAPVFT